MSDSASYYAARAIEERRLAMAATNPSARAAHLEMAARYAELAGSDAVPIPSEQPKQVG